MRILFLALDVDLAQQRGDAVHTIELAKAFTAAGHEVALIVGARPVRPAISSRVVVSDASGSDAAVIRSVMRTLRSFRPSVVYERRTTPKISVALRMLARVPAVLEVNGILEEELQFQGRSRAVPRGGIRMWARGVMFRRLDGIVAVSREIAADLAQRYRLPRLRIRVVGNGVDVDRFRPRAKADACAKLGWEFERHRVLFVGNLIGWRDLDSVLDAFYRVVRTHPAAELVIVGDGPDRSRLEARARAQFPSGAVIFKGTIPHSLVPACISSADVCLLPERPRSVDISPLKLFEYMSCARPVVAYRVSGLEELDALGAGRLVPPGDSAALGEAISDLLSNPAERELMGSRARAFVERNRSWRVVATSISSLLQSVARDAS